MAPLLICHNATKIFGTRVLFENISFTVSEGERIGLIGPNGAGKTTLLELLVGLQPPDGGEVSSRKGLRIAYVEQQPRFDPVATAVEMVREAAARPGLDAHEREAAAHLALGRAGFLEAGIRASELSGGWQKRLAIARALAAEPELLLLDEPTNHLDLDGILWLEGLLRSASFGSVVVTHDRYFLENFATDVMEVNRVYPEGLLRAHGNYSEFLLRREDFLHAQAKETVALANKVRREVEWLRRGPKARTTKSKARIHAAEQLMSDLAGRNARAAAGVAQIDFTASDRKTKRLVTARALSKSLGGRKLFDKLDFTLMPGLRLGIVGPNGSGKTTLLRLINCEVEPDAGEIEYAEGLRVVYFEQSRASLDPALSLRRALAPDGDSVIVRDRPVHVAAWARRFLFRNEHLDMPVGRLSGGESARVHIARLMLEPADVLLLDEPTNDLDIPTLEVLEENLMEFSGALVLVTHDRYLLDRVSNAVAGLDGKGGAELFADYSQWQQWRDQKLREAEDASPSPQTSRTAKAQRKLSYLEQREWDTLEARIESAEAEVRAAEVRLNDPAVTGNPAKLAESYAQLQAAQVRVDELYHRWSELEEKQASPVLSPLQ